ncbi:MAG: anti-sigma regulatory factor [Nitrospiraceae bacterium]
MVSLPNETIFINSPEDLLRVRQAVRAWAVKLGFNLVDQAKIITAASELTRNVLEHGGGSGTVRLETLMNDTRRGLRLTFEDKGPGIPDIALAMKRGYTTKNGLGLGLSGAKRLVNDFMIESRVGEGTRVTITRWV